MEQRSQLLRCIGPIEYNLQTCLWVDQTRDSLVKHSLAPADLTVETAIEEVHEVSLTKVSKRHDLLPRQRSRTSVMQIANGDPLFNVSW